MVDETLTYREPKKSFWRRPSRGLLPTLRWARAGARTDSAANARRAAVAMLIAFALFALFDSRGIRSFARDLPGNAATDVMVDAADRWHALMQRLGPATLAPAVRDRFDRLREIGW
jgi:hypothetical protein